MDGCEHPIVLADTRSKSDINGKLRSKMKKMDGRLS